MRNANRATAVVAHIETALGFENAEQIISTPHLDMVYVGPYDSSIALGHPGQYDHPSMKRALGRVLELCEKHKVAFGTTASGPAAAGKWIQRGCRFFEVVDELALISEAARETVSSYRSQEQRVRAPTPP